MRWPRADLEEKQEPRAATSASAERRAEGMWHDVTRKRLTEAAIVKPTYRGFSPRTTDAQARRSVIRRCPDLETLGAERRLIAAFQTPRQTVLKVGFSIAASVKPFLVMSCHIPSARRSALADVAARSSCFSSRLARDHLMMG